MVIYDKNSNNVELFYTAPLTKECFHISYTDFEHLLKKLQLLFENKTSKQAHDIKDSTGQLMVFISAIYECI
jgi:hypothetical protein